MQGDSSHAPNQETEASSRFPTAYTILFLLIILVAALTWIIPAGSYDRVMNDTVGKEIAVVGSYHEVEANPQGFVDVMLAPGAGFYDPDSYVASAIDVALFVLFLGGFWASSMRPAPLIPASGQSCENSQGTKSG